MPTYQYQCDDCGNGFEQFQKFSDDPLIECPTCGGTIRRVIGNVGVVFKGSGWYINDSRPKSQDSAESPAKAKGDGSSKEATPKAGSDSGKVTESKSAESKSTETKTTDVKPAAAASV
jgi:putative FmdB family regulatory protein